MSDALEGEVVSQPPKSRLTKHDENIVLLLETAFHNGYNITEACQHADISRTTFYEWMADDDVFSYRMSLAQSALNRKAKTNVFQAINDGDPGISLRFLTLRDPDFKPKAEVENINNDYKEKQDALSSWFNTIRHNVTSDAGDTGTDETTGDDIQE